MVTRAAAIACCMVLLAACAAGDSRTESFPPPAAVQEPEGAPSPDEALFEFTAARLGGGSQVTGAELQGKDVALWFWAPW